MVYKYCLKVFQKCNRYFPGLSDFRFTGGIVHVHNFLPVTLFHSNICVISLCHVLEKINGIGCNHGARHYHRYYLGNSEFIPFTWNGHRCHWHLMNWNCQMTSGSIQRSVEITDLIRCYPSIGWNFKKSFGSLALISENQALYSKSNACTSELNGIGKNN